MDAVFIAAAIFGLVLAFIMTFVAVRLLRDSRDRSSARVAALQAAVESMETPVNIEAMDSPVMVEAMDSPVNVDAMDSPAVPTLPVVPVVPVVPQYPTLPRPTVRQDDWDLALGEEFTATPPAPVRMAEPRTVRPPQVRTSNFELRSSSTVPDHDLFERTVEAAPSRRWQWMAAAALVIGLGGGAFYVISSGLISRVSAADGPKATVAPASAAPIELLSLRNANDAGQFVVTGLVQNPAAGASMRDVFAVVYLFDNEGKYFASGRAALESAVLSPGGEAAFVVKVPASMTVSRYRVSFQQQDGAGVVHVDRRGTLPEGTTGDSVEAPPASPAAPTSARKYR